MSLDSEQIMNELERHLDTPSRSLPMYHSKGYWMYSVSPKEVTQFHSEGDSNVRDPSFSLGRFNLEDSKWETKKYLRDARYDPEKELAYICVYSGGSGGRSVTVRLVCPSWKRLGLQEPEYWYEQVISVSEPSPLQYEIVAEYIHACKYQKQKNLAKPNQWDFVEISEGGPPLSLDPVERAFLLLRSLERRCFHKFTTWWRYKFCFGVSITQFHEEQLQIKGDASGETQVEAAISAEHNLGKYDPSKRNLHVFDKFGPESAYISETYVDGDVCTLTGKPRTTEIRYRCGEGERASWGFIVSLTEVETCSYQIVLEVSEVCQHPSFKIEKDPVSSIDCIQEITGDASIEEDEKRKTSMEFAELLKEELQDADNLHIANDEL